MALSQRRWAEILNGQEQQIHSRCNLELPGGIGMNVQMACPLCGEVIWDAPVDEEKMFRYIVYHCWSAHDTKTKEDLYKITGISEEE